MSLNFSTLYMAVTWGIEAKCHSLGNHVVDNPICMGYVQLHAAHTVSTRLQHRKACCALAGYKFKDNLLCMTSSTIGSSASSPSFTRLLYVYMLQLPQPHSANAVHWLYQCCILPYSSRALTLDGVCSAASRLNDFDDGFCDLTSYVLQQDYHFMLIKDFGMGTVSAGVMAS